MELRRCLVTCHEQRAPVMVTQSLETPRHLLAMNGMPSQGLPLTVFWSKHAVGGVRAVCHPILSPLSSHGWGKLPYEPMVERRRPRVSFYMSLVPNLNDLGGYGVFMVGDRLWSSASTVPDCPSPRRKTVCLMDPTSQCSRVTRGAWAVGPIKQRCRGWNTRDTERRWARHRFRPTRPKKTGVGPSQWRNQPMCVFHFCFIFLFIISVLFPNQKFKLNSNSGFNF
jgi:hypothetical protein